MKNTSLLIPLVLAGLLSLTFASNEPAATKSAQSHQEVIAILQTAPHPALDAVKNSFKKELENQLGQDVIFIEQNGFGQMSSLQTMAQSFHQKKNINLVLAIGTPAVQAMASVEKKRPIVFAAVTDPSILKIDLEKSQVFGISDGVEASEQIQQIKASFPSVKRIGLIFSVCEANSIGAIQKLKEAIEKQGLESIEIGLQLASEIGSILESSSSKCDLWLAPTDNLVAMSMPLISRIAQKKQLPIVTSDIMLFDQGATAAFGIDYNQAGVEAANLALSLLKNSKPVPHVQLMQARWVKR